MCRGQQICVLLGSDPALWDRRSPLPPPAWTRDALTRFAESVALVGSSQADSISTLALTRTAELSDFFIEHAQIAGRMRLKAQHRRAVRMPDAESLRYDKKIERAIYERDGYTCRYCDGPVIADSVLRAYSMRVGTEVFPVGNTNLSRHGVMLAFRASVDHVDPRSRGGTDDVENLVTSCWPCNFGKSSYALDELLLDDPRERVPGGMPDWHGLTDFLGVLRGT